MHKKEKKVKRSGLRLLTQSQGERVGMETGDELNHVPVLYGVAKLLQNTRVSQTPFTPVGYTQLHKTSQYELIGLTGSKAGTVYINSKHTGQELKCPKIVRALGKCKFMPAHKEVFFIS